MASLLGSHDDCVEYFFKMKWPNGFRCCRCGHEYAYQINTRRLPLYQCKACHHQTSLLAGTVMERSRTPLHKWAVALQFLSQPSSVNAVRLSEIIKVTYKTAWSMLRKIRLAISETDVQQPLSGTVRAGLSFYGRDYYHQPFVKHRSEHPVLVGAAFLTNGEPLYVKIKLVSKKHMDGKYMYRSGEQAFVEKHVQNHNLDTLMLKRFRLHEVSLLPQLMKQAKTWVNRTFHGIGAKYLQSYMDEFCFRMNQSYRNSPVMDSLSGICTAHRPI